MVLQRAVSTYKFKLGVKRAVKSGARVRAVRIIRHGGAVQVHPMLTPC